MSLDKVLSMKFSEEDYNKVADFINMVGSHAEFKMSTTDLIKYFWLLSHMQKVVLPKIEANIAEVKQLAKSKTKNEGE